MSARPPYLLDRRQLREVQLLCQLYRRIHSSFQSQHRLQSSLSLDWSCRVRKRFQASRTLYLHLLSAPDSAEEGSRLCLLIRHQVASQQRGKERH